MSSINDTFRSLSAIYPNFKGDTAITCGYCGASLALKGSTVELRSSPQGAANPQTQSEPSEASPPAAQPADVKTMTDEQLDEELKKELKGCLSPLLKVIGTGAALYLSFNYLLDRDAHQPPAQPVTPHSPPTATIAPSPTRAPTPTRSPEQIKTEIDRYLDLIRMQGLVVETGSVTPQEMERRLSGAPLRHTEHNVRTVKEITTILYSLYPPGAWAKESGVRKIRLLSEAGEAGSNDGGRTKERVWIEVDPQTKTRTLYISLDPSRNTDRDRHIKHVGFGENPISTLLDKRNIYRDYEDHFRKITGSEGYWGEKPPVPDQNRTRPVGFASYFAAQNPQREIWTTALDYLVRPEEMEALAYVDLGPERKGDSRFLQKIIRTKEILGKLFPDFDDDYWTSRWNKETNLDFWIEFWEKRGYTFTPQKSHLEPISPDTLFTWVPNARARRQQIREAKRFAEDPTYLPPIQRSRNGSSAKPHGNLTAVV